MKLYISNQHGAIIMALLPFLYGMFIGTPSCVHIPLLFAWFSLYLLTYPLFNLVKRNNIHLNKQWCWRYFLAALFFALPTLWYNWKIIWFLSAMLPLGFINLYYVKQKNERALINDIAAIIIFSIAGMAAYYFPNHSFDIKIWAVFWYPTLFFIGTTLYVKSVMRERKNPIYLYSSIVYHAMLVIGVFIFINQPTTLCFLPALVRSVIVPRYRFTIKQVGLLEIGIALIFLFGLCLVDYYS